MISTRAIELRLNTYMDVLLAELLRQGLAQRPERKLARRKTARVDVTSQTRRRTSEEERPAPPETVNLVLLER